MKNNKVLALLIVVLILILSIFTVREIKSSFQDEANQAVHKILSEVKKTNPDVNVGQLIKTANTQDLLDLSEYGIVGSAGILDFNNSRNQANIIMILFVVGVTTLIGLYLMFTSISQKRQIQRFITQMEKINQGIYDIRLSTKEEDFAILENELYKLTVKLREEAENAKASQKFLKKTLEDISHQIKTPITSMQLIIDNLKDPEIDRSAKNELIDYLQTEITAITNLVLMLLNIAALESGTVEFKNEDINLEKLLNEVKTLLAPISKARKINIRINVSNTIYTGDPKWEKELYINLIKNALENSTGPEVNIIAKDSPTFFEVAVINESEEIPAHAKDKIFERFYKLSSADSSYGLGLNICKMIAEANNARIFLHSKAGETNFTVRYYKLEY